MRRSSSSHSTISLLRTLYIRNFSTSRKTTTTTTTINTLPTIITIPLVYRSNALRQSQQVLTEYFRHKRALPFTYVEQIINNSTYSIYETISKHPFSYSDFRYTFQKFITDNPINDFTFFYESIGIDYLNIHKFLKPNVQFFSDDCIVLDAACCFAEFGFPWNKLGRLYVEDELIFRQKPEFLRGRLDRLVSLGFDKQQIFDICVAFPGLLKEEGALDCDSDALLDDLKRIFDFGFPSDKLFVEEFLTFRNKLEFLRGTLDRLASLGFGNLQVVGILLAFPGLLKEEGGLDCDFDALLDDLKRVFLDLDLESCMVGNWDVWLEVCEKVKVFYELGVEKGEFGKLIVKGKSILTGYPMKVLAEKIEFFSRLRFKKSEVAVLILSNPEILSMKFDDRVKASSILERFGLSKKKLSSSSRSTISLVSSTTGPLKNKSHATRQAREELTDYLHSKRALPVIYAEKISKNSTHSMSEIISKIPYSPTNFRYTFREFIRSNPINEFGFFCESIGIDYQNIDKLLKPKEHFLEDDSIVFDAACCLAEFGFPWDKLGRLYVEENLIFRKKPEFLRGRLDRLVSLGFDKQQIVGICLAFPGLLKEEEGGLDSDCNALFDDLKWVFLDFGFPLDKLERLYVEDDLIFRKKLEFLRGRFDRLASLGFGNQQVVGILLAFPGLLKEEGGLDCDYDALLDDLIFRKKLEFLRGRLDRLASLGFGNQQVVGILLSFPGLLKEEGGLDCDYDALLDDLKRVFLDLDLESCMVGNSDVWFEVCEKVKFFHELGVEKGEFGKLIVKGKSILTGYPMEALGEKVEFFSRLGFEKSEVGVLILSNPKILGMKIDDRVISVSSFLEHFGLCKEKLLSVEQKYKHVFGRNKMVNLPSILRALDLHEWFFDRMMCGYWELFASYDLSSPDDGLDENYAEGLKSLETVTKHFYFFRKLKFFHSIGFGENGSTVKLLTSARGSPSALQERFDLLLSEGIEFSKLCKMMSRVPQVFTQEIDSLKKKINFLVEEIGLPLDYLETFPTYLQHNLEKQIKPRYKFHVWLTDQGWCTKKYTLSTIIGRSHKAFLSHLSRIHPSAPQLWMEQYGNKKVDGSVSEKQTLDYLSENRN